MNKKEGTKMKKVFAAFALGIALFGSQSTVACPSEVTLHINSSNYSGLVNVELRQGRRPGSKVVRRSSVDTRGTVRVPGVCGGTYFFTFSTPKDESVSLTRYFEVEDDGTSYSNPVITVTYSRVSSGGQKVGSAKKSEL
jgi:hypothetical protein